MPTLFTPHSVPRLILFSALVAGLSLPATPAAGAQLQVKHGTTVIAENSTYDFGSTLVGEDLSVTITVKNVGPSAVTLGPWSLGTNIFDPGRFVLGDVNVPSPLAAGASGTVELIYQSTGPGTVTNSFRIFEGGTADWEFFPQATAVEPLGPIPRVEHNGSAVPHNSTFQYGSTPLGTDIVETFRVFNDGDQNLTIGTYGFSYSGNPLNSFSVENASVVNVPPGGSGTFDLRFHADGVETTTWKIRLFVGGVSRYEYWVTGTVDPPPMPDLRIKKGSTTIPSGGTYNAGLIGFNDPLTVTFTALNQGDDPLHISNVDFTGDRLQLVQAPPGSIAPNGGTGTFKLRLKADIEGPHSPLVKVWSDDPDENPYEFFLSWTVDDALGPVLRVQLGGNIITQGELVNFGNTGVDMPLSRTFTAYNDGDQPLTIGTISIGSHTNDPAAFDVGFNHVQNVQPGGNAQFRLDFDAAGLGSVTSEIDLFVGGISRREFFVKGTVLPPDFEISVAPASRTVEPGQNAFYTVSVNPLFGFTGTVGLSISNLPPGTNHDFTPFNVPAGGSSQLKVRTFTSTPPVTNHTFTVRGMNGGNTRTDTARITVMDAGSFTLDATPSSRTLSPGDSTTYTVTLQSIDGFSEPVALSLSGLPAGATHSFNPGTVTPTGTSTLTVNTATSSPLGNHTLTVSGSGGGVGDSDQVSLNLIDSGPAPQIDGIDPDHLPGGQQTTVMVTGENLNGASVSIATEPANPGDPVPAAFPPVTVLSVNPAGTVMHVLVDATDPQVNGFYTLVASNASGEAGGVFRVLGHGPVVDAWTPAEPARDRVYNLLILGENLQGATVTTTSSGIQTTVLGTTDTQITGVLQVAPNAPLGPATLRVWNNGVQVTLPIDIVATASLNKSEHNMMARAKQEAAKKGEKVPDVFFQELAFDPSLPLSKSNVATKGEAGGQEALCFITLGWSIYSYQGVFALPFDPLTGRLDDDVLAAMELGETIPIGARVISIFVDLFLEVRFSCFPVSHIEICLFGFVGVEIPGIGGQVLTAGGCFLGGVFFPFLHTTGILGTWSFGTTNPSCASAAQTTVPGQGGNQEAEVTLTDCCPTQLTVSGSGTSFPEFPAYTINFSDSEFPITPVEPSATCEHCDDTGDQYTFSFNKDGKLISSRKTEAVCLRAFPPVGGKFTFHQGQPDQLCQIQVIPESDLLLSTPQNEILYRGDGFYQDGQPCFDNPACFGNQTTWFKVPDHCTSDIFMFASGDFNVVSCCNRCAEAIFHRGPPTYTQDCHPADHLNPFCDPGPIILPCEGLGGGGKGK